MIGTGPIQPAQVVAALLAQGTHGDAAGVGAVDHPAHRRRAGTHRADRFPDGTNIVFSPYLVHHQDRYFPDAQTFDRTAGTTTSTGRR